MSTLTVLAKNAGGVISKNSPTILTGLAVAGLISTTVLAVKATPKALLLLEEARANPQFGTATTDVEPWKASILAKWDVIRVVYRCYLPTVGVAAASILCIVGANRIGIRRNAALAGIYAITDSAFREYQSKVVETIGKNKELAIRDEVSADRLKAHPQSSSPVVYTGKGDVLCYDSLTGRYFYSSVETIRRILNDLNRTLMTDMFITLNEMYFELGLDGTELGSALGWDIDKGLIDVQFSSHLSSENEPCLVLNYTVFPRFMS